MKIFDHCVEIPPRILKVISPHPAKPISLKLETYSLGLLAKTQSHRVSLVFTPAEKERNTKVSREVLKMKIFCPWGEIQARILKIIFSPHKQKITVLNLKRSLWTFWEKWHHKDSA